MMDLSSRKSRETCVDSIDDGNERDMLSRIDFNSKDFTVKAHIRRPKPIPPPLNLKTEFPESPLGISTTLKEFAILATGPHSPLVQKNLPFRKRAHSVPDDEEHAPASAPPTVLKFFPALMKQERPTDDDCSPPLNLSLPSTPKGFQERESGSPNEISVVSSTLTELASPLISSSSHPLSPLQALSSMPMESSHLAPNPFARHHVSPWSSLLPTLPVASHWLNGSPSALLSPAPSSLGSSQEDLPHALPLSSVSSLVYESDPWRLPWPYPVWHCFQVGTVLQISINGSNIVLRAEEVHQCEELQYLNPERLGPLHVMNIKPMEKSTDAVEISFACIAPNTDPDFKVVATCFSYHTFLAIEKGWCAASPELVLRQYGIQCQVLECGDYCPFPPKVSLVSSPGICEKFKRFSFSPEELGSSLSAASSSLVLSPPNTPTMKSQQLQQKQSPNQPTSSQPCKGSKSAKQRSSTQQNSNKPAKTNKVPLDPDRPKRPMNAFMLFAKEHRLKLIRMHPGKDNRFVSVILGEAWRQLPADQKEVFISEAKALSSERKRLHPECWKRANADTCIHSCPEANP